MKLSGGFSHGTKMNGIHFGKISLGRERQLFLCLSIRPFVDGELFSSFFICLAWTIITGTDKETLESGEYTTIFMALVAP